MKTKFSGILTLFLAFVVQFSFAQVKTISGTVSDENGLPLPGVNILVKGTTNGTQTDFDGNYSVSASQGNVLVFSFLGYKTVEKVVGASNNISFSLSPDSEQLQEVVITGYGIQRQKKTLTYQAENLGDEELVKVAPTRAASGMAGKVAGLQINVQNNGVNPSTQVILRGLRSISQSNTALIVIDGAISSQGAFDDLNPNDIESINVLKGATAAALYGSLAGNGALIVTTKKGKKGERYTIGINSATTIEAVAYMPKFQSEYGTGWQGVYDNVENTNWGPRFDGQIRQIGPTFADGSFQAVPYAPVKDNLLDFYDQGSTLQNTVYFTGGGENSTFYLSIGDLETKGIVPDDFYERNTFRLNASKTLGKLTLSLNSSLLRDHTNVVGNTIGDQDRPLYWFVLNTPANIPLSTYRDWDNPNSYAYADNYFNAYYQNPYWAIGTNRNIDDTNRLTANIAASWDIKDWLNFTTRLGVNYGSGNGKNWRAAQTYDPVLQPAHSAVSSFVEDTEFSFFNYTTDLLLTGKFNLTEDISLNSILGATQQTYRSRNSFMRVENLSIPGFYDVSNGTGQPVINVDESVRKTYGYFADLTFGFKDFLFLNASGRYDFTSTLRSGDNSYFYPAIGLSFVATDAIPSLKEGVLSYLKLTASNSTVYNDPGAYAINETYVQSTGFPFGSLNGFANPGTAVDPDLTKEKINTTEFGVNMAFFNNRLTLDAAYFLTKSTDLITSTTSSVAAGIRGSSLLTNIGELEGKGYEITLGGTILKAEDFSWDMSINFTSNETVVNEINAGASEVALTTTGQYGIYAVVGEAFPQIKASSYVRDPEGRVVIDPASGNPVVGSLKNLGKTTPDYIIGLTSSVNYKGFRLSTTWDYRTGHVYYEQGSDAMEFTGRSLASVSANRQDFVWPNSVYNTGTDANPVYVANTNIPVTDGLQDFWTNTYNEIKENYVKDATALKMREIALTYDLPSKFLEKSIISAVRVGFIGRNLLTWLPAENAFADPEFNNTNSNSIGIGGYFQSPPTRSYGFSLNVEF